MRINRYITRRSVVGTSRGLHLPFLRLPALCFTVTAVSAAASAGANLVIDPIFDSSVTSLPNAAQVEGAFNYAAQQLETHFGDPITVSINVTAVDGTSTLGSSQSYLVGYYGYSDVRGALAADATTATDRTAVANLPIADPTGGNLWAMSTANARALGFSYTGSVPYDGIFSFGTGYSYTFDPNNRAVSGKFDFIGIAEHEMTEIMGRIPGLGVDFGDGPVYFPYDLFRFNAPGSPDFTAGSNDYFSIDNGNSNLMAFNDATIFGGDPQDWAGATNDSFNAFTSPGVENDVTPVDYTAMDAIGYDYVVPEPGSLSLMGLASVGLLARRRVPRCKH